MKRNNAKRNQSKMLSSTLIGLIFSFGFGSGYVYYESNLPVVFSSEAPSPVLSVCFSPEGRCENVIVNAIVSAKKEILVQCYSFTSKPIADALLNAKKKGVLVRILFDKSQLKAPYSQIHRLIGSGITAKVDKVSGIAHNKIIIIDNTHLITGSYNFSKAANSRNSENMLLINNSRLIKAYKNEWQRRFER